MAPNVTPYTRPSKTLWTPAGVMACPVVITPGSVTPLDGSTLACGGAWDRRTAAAKKSTVSTAAIRRVALNGISCLSECESRVSQNMNRAASCIVRGPPMVEVMRPAVPGPLAANVEAGLLKTGVLRAL